MKIGLKVWIKEGIVTLCTGDVDQIVPTSADVTRMRCTADDLKGTQRERKRGVNSKDRDRIPSRNGQKMIKALHRN